MDSPTLALNRRKFLSGTVLPAAAFALLPHLSGARANFLMSPQEKRNSTSLKIANIETKEILPPLHDYNATTLLRYMGIGAQARTIYIVQTNNGLEGYGETWGLAPKKEEFTQYFGTNPFDWVAEAQSLPMSMAVYDLMGKFLGLPIWKLLGPQVRKWVPVAAWTVSQDPKAMGEEVIHVSKRGYRWLKYHVNSLQNVIDQTAAMQKVAPAGFKVHYDFNADSNLEAVYPVLRELEKFPLVGRIEDPISIVDEESWRILREKCSIPIIFHYDLNLPEFFVRHSLCDGFMASRLPIGIATKLAHLAEITNTPFVLQQPGGMISQAFLAHEASVFKMASLNAVPVTNLWKDDVTVGSMPVVNGTVEVPNGPGLGIALDRQKLEQYSKAGRPKLGRFLVRVRYSLGPYIYFRFNPNAPGANIGSHLGTDVPGPVPGYGNQVVTDFWDQEGSTEFEQMWRRTESGPVWTERES